MRFVDLGRRSFAQALRLQEEAVSQVAGGRLDETVHLVEHPHTFTIGRSGDASNLISQRDWEGNPIELMRIGRGGDITYHGPGQLVGYPHFDLRLRGRDVHAYLRDMEEALISAAAAFGIRGYRRPGFTGVWTEEGKLASIGVGVRRWVTLHGFALNVDTDLRYFQLINPCGTPDCPITSIRRLAGRAIDFEEAKKAVRQGLIEVFDLSPSSTLLAAAE